MPHERRIPHSCAALFFFCLNEKEKKVKTFSRFRVEKKIRRLAEAREGIKIGGIKPDSMPHREKNIFFFSTSRMRKEAENI